MQTPFWRESGWYPRTGRDGIFVTQGNGMEDRRIYQILYRLRALVENYPIPVLTPPSTLAVPLTA
jgi:hypothetical protein